MAEATYKGKVRTEGAIRPGDYLPTGQKVVLGLQHAFTMFGATVLVPILTGLDISVTLFCAGVGTILFHLVTKGKVPAFLGSSFAFIAPISLVVAQGGIPAAQGGIIVAGLIYLLMAGLVYLLGADKVLSIFPPVVTGPIIMVIGLNLAPVAVKMSSANWLIALIVLATAAVVTVYVKGFFRLVPVITGLAVGYVVSMLFGLVDFSAIKEAPFLAVPGFTMPVFSMDAILLIAPVAIVTMIEHIGDVFAISETVEQDFMLDPGVHRTLIGDGLATALAGFFGGPPNTTYSENTGVLALTKVWIPIVMQIAAVAAIILSFSGTLRAIISTIPTAVVGGISILLFGMIASVGIRTVVENQVDMKKSRNLIIASTILVLGIGGAVFQITEGIAFAGMSLGAIAGLILNKVLPE